jgi:DNA ligase (NAD+)
VVFTGALRTMTRDEAQEAARRLGARTASSVTRGTTLVVAGDRPGTKMARAGALGVRVIDEAGFAHLLSNGRARRAPAA